MGWKIVRDKQPPWAKSHGVSGQWRFSLDPVGALRKKLGEELGEYTENNDPAELYDLRDVLDRLISLLDPHGVHALSHEAKVERLGRFFALIEWTPIPVEAASEEVA